MEHRVPDPLRGRVRGKRIAIVDDAVNAGSAVRGTFADLEACGAQPAAIGALLLLGPLAADFAASKGVPMEALAHLPSQTWEPPECPLCAAGIPLDDPAKGTE